MRIASPSVLLLIGLLSFSRSFTPSLKTSHLNVRLTSTGASSLFHHADDDDDDSDGVFSGMSGRRSVLSLTAQTAAVAAMLLFSSPSHAGIDVSGLRSEGSSISNPDLASQLRTYDGSGTTRVREIQQQQQSKPASTGPAIRSSSESTTTATWAYRAAPGFNPSLTTKGPLFYRYDDRIVAPPYLSSKRNSLNVQFEFPSDWLALDRASGGIQYVDQRNGDKLYVLQARLPEGTTLSTVPKSFFGDAIFDPNGSIVKSGTIVDDYKVSSSQIISECPDDLCATRRRLKLKYATVTGNGLRVERRALVDVYDVSDYNSAESSPPVVYMMMASVNANKFEASNSLQRETAERIVNSFRVE